MGWREKKAKEGSRFHRDTNMINVKQRAKDRYIVLHGALKRTPIWNIAIESVDKKETTNMQSHSSIKITNQTPGS